MMTTCREEEPKGCLMWTSRMWLLLIQERAASSQNLMMRELEEIDSIKPKWFMLYFEDEFPDREACWLLDYPAHSQSTPSVLRENDIALERHLLGTAKALEKRLPFKPSASTLYFVTTLTVLWCGLDDCLSSPLAHNLQWDSDLAYLVQCPGPGA